MFNIFGVENPQDAIIVFAIVAIFSTIMIFISKNPVYSVIFMILTFCNIGVILITLGLDFLGIIFIIIYVGAITVLFLFVIMTLNIKRVNTEKKISFSDYIILIVTIISIVEIYFVSLTQMFEQKIDPLFYNHTEFLDINSQSPALYILSRVNSIDAIGLFLYTDYVFLFIVSGLILLVAMMGAIVITLKKKDNVKEQDKTLQLNRKSETSVTCFKK